MAGYTDWAFRVGIRQLGGVGLAYTEMISPETILYGSDDKVRLLTFTTPEDQPLSYQIYGKDPDVMLRGALRLVEMGAKLIDVNMGCPQRDLSTRGRGAGLLRTPDLAVQIVDVLVKGLPVPVTVKMRLGWAEDAIVAPQLAERFAELGVAAVVVHGRTRAQGFSGPVDWQGIRRVVEAVPGIPVIANGDIRDVGSALRVFEQTGCAGIMLGREPLANPWIMRDISRALFGEKPAPPPTPEDRVQFMRGHFERYVQLAGERWAVIRFRKWLRLYIRGCAFLRDELQALMQITDVEEWRARVPSWVLNLWRRTQESPRGWSQPSARL